MDGWLITEALLPRMMDWEGFFEGAGSCLRKRRGSRRDVVGFFSSAAILFQLKRYERLDITSR
jgi:hypothetical protein